MNIGLDNATGDYVGIIESDDFADLGMFETLYNMAVENKVDLVKSDWYCYWTKIILISKQMQYQKSCQTVFLVQKMNLLF